MGFALEKPAEAIRADRAWQQERGQARWRSVWSAGMIGERVAKELADRVWA